MIYGKFIPPDRRCTFKDADGHNQDRLLRADQEQETRERLEITGCTDLVFIPYDFSHWLDEADRETQKIIADYNPEKKIDFDSKIWRALRRYITMLFHDKCAYCEVSIEAGAPTHVEHYRPKSTYYWLAYRVDNYVPACAWCNGKKGSKFPLADDGIQATKPGHDLDLEKPLLVNPSTQQPEKHLSFVTVTDENPGGRVDPLSPEGEVTIKMLGLNRFDLFERRRQKQEKVRVKVGVAWTAGPTNVRQFRAELESGVDVYSAAQLAQFKADWEAAGL